MNTTSEAATPGAPSIAGDASAAAPAAAAGDVASSAAAAPAAAAPSTAKEPKKSRAQAAFDRAVARRAPTGAAPSNTPAARPQAGGDGNGAVPAASTDAAADPTKAEPAAGERGAESTNADSTVNAPDDWPEPLKGRFTTLPNDDARGMVLDFYKDMHKGFSESMNRLAQLRKGHEDLVRTMDEYGVDPEETKRVLGLSSAFSKDPRGVLKQLASTAGVEVYFERPLPEGELPQFKDAKEMAEYIRQQTLESVRRENETRAEADRHAREERETREALKRELSDARSKYGNDWKQHETAVFERLAANPALSVEDAYGLATLSALRKQADDGRRAQAELANLKAKLEAERKAATQPVGGLPGNGKAKDDKFLSPGQRAFNRAAAKRATNAHA